MELLKGMFHSLEDIRRSSQPGGREDSLVIRKEKCTKGMETAWIFFGMRDEIAASVCKHSRRPKDTDRHRQAD